MQTSVHNQWQARPFQAVVVLSVLLFMCSKAIAGAGSPGARLFRTSRRPPSQAATEVLIAGGCCDQYGDSLASAELYDPGSGTFTATAAMVITRETFSATSLPSGEVLIAGGLDSSGLIAVAEVYNSNSETFVSTGTMNFARDAHTATLLPDGNVLVAGGCCDLQGRDLASAELYDPSSGAFTPTGSMAIGRDHHTATLLESGKVLLAGGCCDRHGKGFDSAELYDPTSGQFTPAGSMTTARFSHSATILNDGQVLIAGGCCNQQGGSLASAELYDPMTGRFTRTRDRTMITARFNHTATLLVNGWVLLAGGCCGKQGDSLARAELYDPVTGKFARTRGISMINARQSHTATLLDDGDVLIAGGIGKELDPLAGAELYDPKTGKFVQTGSMAAARANHTAIAR